MPDCLAAQLLDGIGAVMDTISTTNGYSQTINTVEYDYFLPDRETTDYAIAIVMLTGIQTVEVDNESQQIAASFRIEGYMKQSTADHAVTVAARKEILEFAADFKTAILSIYDRQQAGTFGMEGFEIVGEIRQAWETPENESQVAAVMTEFDCKFLADRGDR